MLLLLNEEALIPSNVSTTNILNAAIQDTTVQRDVFLFLLGIIICLFIHVFLYSLYKGLGIILRLKSNRVRAGVAWFFSTLFIFSFYYTLYPINARVPVTFFNYAFFTSSILLIISFLVKLKLSTKPRKNELIGTTLFVVAVFFIPTKFQQKDNVNVTRSDKPNVIFIGIDSLRHDYIDKEHTPFLNSISAESQSLTNVYTPAARTSSAWFSLLTGRYPINHGMRFNLTPNHRLQRELLFTYKLKEAGYNTAFVQDERRFNNIGKAEGFDTVVGPPIGASEFALASTSGIPLFGLMSNLWFMDTFMPQVQNNRAAWRTYKPLNFNKKALRKIQELDNGAPLFLASHFTLPHWPYQVSYPIYMLNEHKDALDYMYITMINHADYQVKLYMEGLKKQGLLDNAIVIFFSDHGESFARDDDGPSSLLDNANFPTTTPGHGTNVLATSQFKVFTKIQTLGSAQKCAPLFQEEEGSTYSLVDLVPSVAACLDIVDENFDGKVISEVTKERPVFMESSINPTTLDQKTLNVLLTVAQGIHFFEIADEGMVRIKEAIYPDAIKAKQRAVIVGDSQLSLFPDMKDDLIYTDLLGNYWQPASTVENKETIGELLNQLCHFYDKDAQQGFIPACASQSAFIEGIYKKWQ